MSVTCHLYNPYGEMVLHLQEATNKFSHAGLLPVVGNYKAQTSFIARGRPGRPPANEAEGPIAEIMQALHQAFRLQVGKVTQLVDWEALDAINPDISAYYRQGDALLATHWRIRLRKIQMTGEQSYEQMAQKPLPRKEALALAQEMEETATRFDELGLKGEPIRVHAGRMRAMLAKNGGTYKDFIIGMDHFHSAVETLFEPVMMKLERALEPEQLPQLPVRFEVNGQKIGALPNGPLPVEYKNTDVGRKRRPASLAQAIICAKWGAMNQAEEIIPSSMSVFLKQSLGQTTMITTNLDAVRQMIERRGIGLRWRDHRDEAAQALLDVGLGLTTEQLDHFKAVASRHGRALRLLTMGKNDYARDASQKILRLIGKTSPVEDVRSPQEAALALSAIAQHMAGETEISHARDVVRDAAREIANRQPMSCADECETALRGIVREPAPEHEPPEAYRLIPGLIEWIGREKTMQRRVPLQGAGDLTPP